jgi:hypothetical protein
MKRSGFTDKAFEDLDWDEHLIFFDLTVTRFFNII